LTVAGAFCPIPTENPCEQLFENLCLQTRELLYIATADGFLKRYNLVTSQIDWTYNLGGSLNGIDIAPDDSFLLIAQAVVSSTQGEIQELNLRNSAVTNIPYTLANGEAGAWDVAIGVNGLALFTTDFAGPGFTPLRQINLATNAVSVRSDVPNGQVLQETQVHRSADGRRMYFSGIADSSTPVFTYSAVTNTFGAASAPGGLHGCAVSRDGSLLATSTYPNTTSLDTAPLLHLVHCFSGTGDGAVFDAKRDILYAVNASLPELIAFDTDSFAQLFRLQVNESPLRFAAFVASPDGQHLAFRSQSAFASLRSQQSCLLLLRRRQLLLLQHAAWFLIMPAGISTSRRLKGSCFPTT
jgi:hypothetical protein